MSVRGGATLALTHLNEDNAVAGIPMTSLAESP